MRTNSSHTEEDCVFFQMVGEFKKKRGEKGKEIWKGGFNVVCDEIRGASGGGSATFDDLTRYVYTHLIRSVHLNIIVSYRSNEIGSYQYASLSPFDRAFFIPRTLTSCLDMLGKEGPRPI